MKEEALDRAVWGIVLEEDLDLSFDRLWMLMMNKFIIFLYMFRALLCSSSGGQNCIIQHLVSSHSVGGRPVRTLSVLSSMFRHTTRAIIRESLLLL